MKKRIAHAGIASVALLVGVLAYAAYCRGTDGPNSIDALPQAGRTARIHPDYVGVTAPPNIAPLNFVVQEEGQAYYVRIASQSGKAIEIENASGRILIPEGPWRKLLQANAGQEIHVDICVRNDDGQWTRFDTITNRIASEPIDDVLVYRRLHPGAGAGAASASINATWASSTSRSCWTTGISPTAVSTVTRSATTVRTRCCWAFAAASMAVLLC